MLLRPVLMPILRNPLQGIADGIRNMLAELLGSSQFFAPLTHSLVLARGTGSPTFTRPSTATVEGYGPTDNAVDGLKLLTVAANEARFVGARRISEGVWSNTFADGSLIPAATNTGYLAEGARTNLCLQSNAFTTTWVNDGLIPVQNSIGPDGGTTAWTLDDNAAGAVERIYQTGITLTAATYTMSVFIKKTSTVPGANSYPLIYATQGANIALATIDPVNGTATVWTTYGGPATVTSSARCTSYNSTYWRVELTFLATAAAWIVAILPAAAAQGQSTGVESAAGVGSQVFYGAQVELGSFASSYIPTTTAAVTRNADVLTYPSVGNVSGSAGWAYFEVTADWSANSGASAIGLGTGSVAIVYMDGTNISFYDGVNADVEGAYVPSAGDKVCVTWGGTTSSIAVNGTVLASGTFTAFTPDATIAIGGRTTGLSQWGGNEKNVRIGQRQLSASEMQAITS